MSKLLALTVLALGASGAMADHGFAPLGDTTTPAPEYSSPSTLSRDEVQAEAARAVAEHSLAPTGDTTTPAPEYLNPSTRSRDEVRAEGREAAHRRHQIDDLLSDY